MLDLDYIRNQFAEHLQTRKRVTMDSALMHVATLAYKQGAKDKEDELKEKMVRPADPA